ncbi:cell wall integrity and stress response component 2-like [Mizuhopecten yessoensis]|uniref:cell wall integrity and stress response component 2-like n=1 Tax=Mizuhopecten yessoensis TaxID=6573 RepID=UPI000B45B67F|nr:cell wall integrity and stress response component 2-like [Mizuhopecten yessoensis]
MRGRRDSFSLLGLTYMLLIIHMYFEGINTTACTDRTELDNFFHVKTMCKSGTLKNTRVVIDTWGTGGLDVYSCTCTVTLGTESASSTTTSVVVEEYPRVAPLQNCGSILVINSTKSSSFTKTDCNPIPATLTNNFSTSDMLTLTLSRADVSTSWISGHCILVSLQGSTNLDIIVTCNEQQGKSNRSSTKTSTTSTSSTTTTTTTPTTTTTTPTTTTTTPTTTTTTKPLTSTHVSQTTSTPTPTHPPSVSSTGGDTATTGEQTGSDVGVIAGAAGGGGLLLIIIIVVIVVIIRKRKPDDKQTSDNGDLSYGNTNGGLSDDIHPYANTSTNKRYVNNDGDTITHNSLYVSAGPRYPDTNYIVTGTGDMYAQVQKPETRSTMAATGTEKLDLEESPQGDVYAVVNKSKNQNKTGEIDDNRPSRYQNPDGLVYAEVSVQDRTSRPQSRSASRPQSRSKSRPPPVSPKPKVDTDNVVYAEVDTSV